ncbi:MAG TPA: ATP-binding protein [Chthoniobacteraceae bacterium]|nr:ATP-binding protein [Chthoniobacteraceae bacterium]
MNSGFLDKLIERIGRVRPEEVQNYLHRLADEKGFLETIFNAIHEGVIVTDLKGRINYLNRAACELFGLERENCMGNALAEKLRGLEWEKLVESNRVVSRDMEVFYPQHRFLNFYVVPLSLEAPARKGATTLETEPVGYAVILRDITETRRSTEETIQSERLTALTLLAAGVAHEIGNPLNSLHIHLQLMERKLRKVPDAVRRDLQDALDVAREEIQRLDSIVQRFLGAIRPAHLETHLENINALVQESVNFLQPEIENRDILVEQELRADLPLVEVDRNQMKQAFYNVIKNAFQAMKTSGLLRIRTDLEDHFVSITFSDSGGGITQENMSKIFEPYFTTKASGTGLGLLIVRRIVREHGGEIDLASHEGRGLTLTIRLPIRNQRARMLAAGGSDHAS